MLIVAVMGEVVALMPVNEGILPEPLAARPIAVLLFVHVNVVPLTGPDTLVTGAITPAQYVWLLIELTVGVGLTVIVNVDGVPVHPFAVGVTVIVLVIGNVPVLLAVYVGIFPVPLVPKPTLNADVQEKIAPLTGPVKFIALPGFPLHWVLLEILLTVAVGLTVMV